MRTEIGKHNGLRYLLIKDKRKNQQACDICPNKIRWFLTVEGYCIGDFATKAEAIKEIR